MSAAAPSWAAGFSPRAFNGVPPAAVQGVLRGMFAAWGLPQGMRLDNGLPWGGGAGNDLPSPLALWLAGLGLGLTFNPPRQPRYNGVVEKSQQTNERWSEPHTAGSAGQWQRRIDEMDKRQREAYPYLRGRSRMGVFPELRHTGRAYSAAWEAEGWDLRQAREYLAGHAARRRADANGRVSVYGRNQYLGRAHKGKDVLVHYDPEAAEWFVTRAGEGQLRRLPAPEICRERILALDISVK